MTDFWTADRIETLRVKKAEGLSATEIAFRIGDGCNRNMVIGKMRRLGIKGGVPANLWSAEEIATLRRLHVESVPYPRIAAVIGRTEAACMNKAAAIGLPSRGHNTSRKPRKGVKTAAWNFKPHLVAGIEKPPTAGAVSIVDATGCLWAITPHDCDKAAHMFCNHPKAEKGPYCEFHAEVNRARPEAKQAIANRRYIPTALLRSVA